MVKVAPGPGDGSKVGEEGHVGRLEGGGWQRGENGGLRVMDFG